MAQILAESASRITLEPIDAAATGAEFRLERDGSVEYHQVKRQLGDRSNWTLASLRREGVLGAMRAFLATAETTFVFVSMVPATQLRELSERARSTNSQVEFEASLGSGDYATEFRRLQKDWEGWTAEQAWLALQRVQVRTIDEITVRDDQRAWLMPLVDGDPDTVADLLAEFALESVGRDLRASDLWAHLARHGLRPRAWDRDPFVRTSVAEQAGRYVRQATDVLIGGALIARSEVDEVVSSLSISESGRMTLLVGDAGYGKSAVLVDVVRRLMELGWPVLPMRIDRLEAVERPDDVGAQLGLAGSPALVLAGLAAGAPAVLVLDQLDAVSLASGRQPAFFECVNEIMRQAEAHPNIRVVVACRRFDLENDHRLRRLQQRDGTLIVEIGLLSDDQVSETLEVLGIAQANLTPVQRELLRTPLHMALLAQASGTEVAAPGFRSIDDLYAGFWNAKRAAVGERLQRPVRWTEVIDVACAYMSDHQVLSAPVTVFDDFAEDLGAMTSEQVFIADGNRRAFFHEGFFDYAFARRFAARGLDLPRFLRQTEQHLFRRAQLRQILQHERAISRESYVAHVEDLLAATDIRFHLKQVVLAFLGTVEDPTAAEWKAVAPLLDQAPDPIGGHAWGLIRRSPAWFDLVDAAGEWAAWLESDDGDRVDRAVTSLAAAQRERPARVAALISEHLHDRGRWVDRLVHVVLRADLTINREFFLLFLALVDNGVLDGITTPFAVNGNFWDLAHGLVESKPQWAAEFASHFLFRRLEKTAEAGEANPFEGVAAVPDPLERDFFVKIAHADAAALLDELVPFLLRVLPLNAQADASGLPWRDPMWAVRFRDTDYGVRHGLLHGIEEALRREARVGSVQVDGHLAALAELKLETADFLVCRALAAARPDKADEAVDFLLGDPRRLELGYADELRWATRELIQAATPHCDETRLRRLESMVLDFYPEWERTADGRQRRGYAQYVLLDGWDRTRMSAAASRRLGELERKFQRPPEEPQKIEVEWVGPAVPREAAERLSDDQWLRAIATHPDDDEFPRRRADLHRAGGAHALASELHDEVVKDPVRFARLLERIPDDANAAYFSNILRGLRDTEEAIPPDLVFDACRRCHRLPSRPCGRWITGPLEKLGGEPIPQDMLVMVAWYATQDPDPSGGRWAIGTSSDSDEYPRDLITAGMNSARGSAALTIGRLIRQDPNRVDAFGEALESLAADPDIAVRSCAAEALISVLVHDPDRAVDLFVRLADGVADDLLATHTADRFLYYAVRSHFGVLKPILERMLGSARETVATAGARHVCLASLEDQPAADLVKSALDGSPAMRLGAAQVYSANLGDASLRGAVTTALITLFDDDDPKVRDEAGTCFRSISSDQLDRVEDLVDAYAASAAIADNPGDVLRALDETTCEVPESGLRVCRRIIELAGPELGDISTHWAAEADEINRVVLRIYAQSTDADIQRAALDLIDSIVATGAYGIDKALSEYER